MITPYQAAVRLTAARRNLDAWYAAKHAIESAYHQEFHHELDDHGGAVAEELMAPIGKRISVALTEEKKAYDKWAELTGNTL